MSKNPQIGTCPCPVTDRDPETKRDIRCTEVMAVRRFATAATDDRHRRKGGKLYADCPHHGRFGFDGAAGAQTYLLDNSELWEPKKVEETADAAKVAEARRKVQHAPTPTPAALTPTKTSTPSSKPASTQAPKGRGLLDWD